MNFVADTVSTDQIEKIFLAQKANQYAVANEPIKARKAKLKSLLKALEITFRQEIRDAMMADFKKPQADVDLSEIFPVTSEIKHTISHLSKWTAKQPADTPLAFFGSTSYITYEPKGVCLIIAPWNFPVNLLLSPLVSAIAGGNTVILKPSEFTPETSKVLAKLIKSLFNENEIALIEGGIETSTSLLDLPFNHIFFTGAPSIGKIVMKAAAKNLASVTLELGGKSPTIVDETASIGTAAKRIVWGKFHNSGQICIAPDYILVHESKKDALIAAMEKVMTTFFGQDPSKSESYGNIVNEKHTERVVGYIQDSVSKGAKVIFGGKSDSKNSFLEPTLVCDVPQESALMQNEIFGPVLPILTYQNLDDAINRINDGEKPLALYIYSKSNKNIEKIMANTRAGNSCINNNDLHYFNPNLPFGGSNNSGIGKTHGIFGFQEFTNARGVYRQHLPSTLELLMPPYNGFKEKMIALIVKLF
ncbi:aldehyde dehydrogenase family protein [Lacihabitans sp. LS3-19]|uniref:aldehyde dehydrogenase family protein n=1 Tax=Lacihabitans sp. LS3-19 TaxID=2487335 RepID=UPI0020CD09F9|nr:aldehyde dehydrogenase family protein [Lacihabitans sp. LS3-19]MCP9768575.1 aldehyde dehydrogenase family protein [Lacihabitans sp. LS3-19]